ncbi:MULTISPECIES: DUF2306 domain-containing protein [Streptosporangium]|uniref:Membrane protein n=1 Tax=Streptosporangium brasiliense TaxID=47480 RepID=A0ABT9R3Q4_9ACTN|nr:DUF2306 domain-containing protein [Streptosporangium brasiliense]MDP9863449.1 putative membrane protein [Streptosporangium brasiliense]
MTDESPTGRLLSPQPPRSGLPVDDRDTTGTSAAASSAKADWLVPAALIVLSAVPVAAGAVRLAELTGGAEITPENARFFAAPLPVVLHILSVSLYSVMGAFQTVPRLRRRRSAWHRVAGRILIPCGLVAAFSGLWMTLFYPRPDGDGDLLSGLRLVFGSAMALAILLGAAAIRRRDVGRHRAWMIRGYAIGLGAGTQVLTHLFWVLIVGTPGELPRALLVGAGWVINLAVAEWIIRRRPAGRIPRPARS